MLVYSHIHLWQIHFDIWQNQYNIVKLNKIKLKKKFILFLAFDDPYDQMVFKNICIFLPWKAL